MWIRGSVLLLLALAGCPSTRSPCASGQTDCGICADLKTDAKNCGACGHACGDGTCVNGACVCSAGATIQNCAGKCVDTATDPKHCGTCDNVCALSGETCAGSLCGCPAAL